MKKVTIYDIAKISGYSPKTVSRAINGDPKVKDSTRKKILKIANEHNFVLNAYARQLRVKANMNILLSIYKRKDAFPLMWFNLLLEKINRDFKNNGYNVFVEYIEESDQFEDSILKSMASMIDGVVLFYEVENDPRIAFLEKIEKPFIMYGVTNCEGVSFVSNDDFSAMYEFGKYILAQGHRKIMMMIAKKTLFNQYRIEGINKAFLESKIPNTEVKVIEGMASSKSVYEYSINHINTLLKYDTVFITGDEKALGLYRALKENDINIPYDISVVAFDNIPFSDYIVPSLSSIAPDYGLLSKEINRVLIEMIESKEKPVAKKIFLPTKLVIRESFKSKH